MLRWYTVKLQLILDQTPKHHWAQYYANVYRAAPSKDLTALFTSFTFTCEKYFVEKG